MAGHDELDAERQIVEMQALRVLLAAHDRSEQFPALALELHHLKLFERGEIGRAGLDLGARQINADSKLRLAACS